LNSKEDWVGFESIGEEIFPNISGLSFKDLNINQGNDDVLNDKEAINGMRGLNSHDTDE
jgi:hypothetical protein